MLVGRVEAAGGPVGYASRFAKASERLSRNESCPGSHSTLRAHGLCRTPAISVDGGANWKNASTGMDIDLNSTTEIACVDRT